MTRRFSDRNKFAGRLLAGTAMAVCLAVGVEHAAAFRGGFGGFHGGFGGFHGGGFGGFHGGGSAGFAAAGSVGFTAADRVLETEVFPTGAAMPGLAAGAMAACTMPAVSPTMPTHTSRAIPKLSTMQASSSRPTRTTRRRHRSSSRRIRTTGRMRRSSNKIARMKQMTYSKIAPMKRMICSGTA